MNTENWPTLKIHKLTQAQYDRELKAGRIDETALYLTPDENVNDNRLLAHGTTNIEGYQWTWKKWANGEAECYGALELGEDGNNNFSSVKTITLPIEFKSSSPFQVVQAFTSIATYPFINVNEVGVALTVIVDCDANEQVVDTGVFVKNTITVKCLACCTENNLLENSYPTINVCLKGRWK